MVKRLVCVVLLVVTLGSAGASVAQALSPPARHLRQCIRQVIRNGGSKADALAVCRGVRV